MVCKKVPGKIARHHVLMTSFGEPSVLPGSQLSKSPLDWTADKDGKRPDRLTLIPRQAWWPFVCLGRYSRQPIIAATLRWWRGSMVERRSLAGELPLSCARPAADE